MATGTQADIFARLKAILPARWFGSPADSTPILDAVLQGIANVLAFVYSLYAYAKLQTRISTATDGYLDLISADFFGTTLQRNTGQSDTSYRALILANLFREKATRNALIRVLQDLTGQTPIVIEPTKPADCGAYGVPFWCYGTNASGAQAQSQAIAANAAALADIAAGGDDFYTELGGASGSPLWNNGNAGYGGGTIQSNTQVVFASVTKSLSATAVAQIRTLTYATDWPWLTMTGGRDLMNGLHCAVGNTIAQCAAQLDGAGYRFDQLNPPHVGLFSYDGGGWQYYFNTVLGLGLYANTDLKTFYKNNLNLLGTDISCTTAMPSGAAQGFATTLRKVVQQIMSGTLNIKTYLQDNNTPVPASDYFGPSLVVPGSPAPSDEPWRYKWGFWVEPVTGDFWMAGSYGTAVWIKNDFSMYGMVVRNASSEGGEGGEIGIKSIRTMQAIRDAYLAAGAPTGVGYYGSMQIPYQAFVQAYRPLVNLPIANVSGYGVSTGAYNTASQASYIDLQSFSDAISDADIYAAIDSVRPAATQVWVHINNPQIPAQPVGGLLMTEDGQELVTEDAQELDV